MHIKFWGLTLNCDCNSPHPVPLFFKCFYPYTGLCHLIEVRKGKVVPDFWELAWHPQLPLGVEENSFTSTLSDQAILWSWHKQEHSVMMTEQRQKQENVQTTKGNKICSIPAIWVAIASLPVKALESVYSHVFPIIKISSHTTAPTSWQQPILDPVLCFSVI